MSNLTHFLIIVPNYWGKGATTSAAWSSVRRAGGPTKRDSNGKYVVYRVHADAVCEPIHGNIQSPKGHRPKVHEIGAGVSRAQREALDAESARTS